MLTSRQVREQLGIGRDKLRELVNSGELTAIRTGSARNAQYRFSEAALAEFIKRNTVVPSGQPS